MLSGGAQGRGTRGGDNRGLSLPVDAAAGAQSTGSSQGYRRGRQAAIAWTVPSDQRSLVADLLPERKIVRTFAEIRTPDNFKHTRKAAQSNAFYASFAGQNNHH
jgi:hypothetical protein